MGAGRPPVGLRLRHRACVDRRHDRGRLRVLPVRDAALSLVRDQLEQAAVRVTEVDALPATESALPLDRAFLDNDAVRREMLNRPCDRAGPAEAEIRVPRPHRVGRARVRCRARPVDVELLVAEPVRIATLLQLEHLGTEHVAVEAVRPLPVGDGDHAVVEDNRIRHRGLRRPLSSTPDPPKIRWPDGTARFQNGRNSRRNLFRRAPLPEAYSRPPRRGAGRTNADRGTTSARPNRSVAILSPAQSPERHIRYRDSSVTSKNQYRWEKLRPNMSRN